MSDTELRDKFAAAALTGLLSSLPNGDQYHQFAVEHAWSLADAMLRERARKNTPTTTLTDEEREAVEASMHGENDATVISTLRALLARLSPPAT